MRISMGLVSGRVVKVKVLDGVFKGKKKVVYLHHFENTIKKSKEKIHYALFGEQPKQVVDDFVQSVEII